MSFKIRILILGLAVTFIPVSTVFAEDSTDFVACQQMKWKAGKKAKKNCFRDLVRQIESEYGSLVEDSEDFVACQQMKWKAGKKAKKNCFRDLARQRESELTSVPSEPQFLVDKNGKDTGFTSITDLCTGVVGISSVLKAKRVVDARSTTYGGCLIEAEQCIDSAAEQNPEHEDSSRINDSANGASAFGMSVIVVTRIISEDSALCTRGGGE